MDRECRVRLDFQGIQARVGSPATREHLVTVGTQEFLDALVRVGTLDLLASAVIQESLDLAGIAGSLVILEHLASQATAEYK